MNSRNLVIVHHGNHRGMWVRCEEDRQRAWEIMATWSEPYKAIAATYPVRIALDAEGWAYVRERALGDGLAAAQFKSLGKQLATPVDPDELPDFPSDDYGLPPRAPSAPWGLIPPFRTESRGYPGGEVGVTEICADGTRVSLGMG